MQVMIGDEFIFVGYDWWYYFEKVCQDKYVFDDNVLKLYFEFGVVCEGVWIMVECLFNVMFEDVEIDGWNEVVILYDVKDVDIGEYFGLFMMDMYVCDSKCGGVWMSLY